MESQKVSPATENPSAFAVFGGQGTHNLDSLKHLRNTYSMNLEQCRKLLDVVSTALEEISMKCKLGAGGTQQSIDVLRWLEDPELTLSNKFLASAPISMPLNGINSLVNYCLSCHAEQKDPGQMARSFGAATGHSQGIIIAAAISYADSWDSFFQAAADAVTLLFLIGFHSQNANPFPPETAILEEEEDIPSSWMLSIRGLAQQTVQSIIDEVNSHLGLPSKRACIALENAADSITVAAPPHTLRAIVASIEGRKAEDNASQDRIPFPLRRPMVEHTFLPVTAPFHSPLLNSVEGQVLMALEDLRQGQPALFGDKHLRIPVYNTNTGENIQNMAMGGNALVSTLIKMITVEKVRWRVACFPQDKHFTTYVDFGPGRTLSILNNQLNGSGRLSIHGGGRVSPEDAVPSPQYENWRELYGPRTDAVSGQLTTRFSELIGAHPVMVAGMTPTTVAPDFVAAIINSGYHAELAGGGYYSPEVMEGAIRSLVASIAPHRGICINLIYANPRAMGWQINLISKLVNIGVNIEGLTIGAGVPSVDTALEYITTLGLKYISFKPGSESAIRQVIEIAAAQPDFPIILQWTGGRAGGHHSCEDQYAALLSTYAAIRAHKNIYLVVGGGLGDSKGMAPFFSGEWSIPFGYAPMPVDGTLMGSHMMTAKEAHTSPAVKQLMIETEGTSDTDWHLTHKGPKGAGGVLTVLSEAGQPIHKLSNRAVILWRELQDTVFNKKDPAERVKELTSRRTDLIQRLNNDYCKPWFAMDAAGNPVELEDLTYFECLSRIVKLMFIGKTESSPGQWIDLSYARFFSDFLARILQLQEFNAFVINKELLTSNPVALLEGLYTDCPDAMAEVLDPDDALFFMELCRRRGQKPVNFIPKFDEDFETWFKKDSLWQSENLHLVPDQDPQKVCIIYGPVAARHAVRADMPAREILDAIMSGLQQDLSPLASPQKPVEDLTPQKSIFRHRKFYFDSANDLDPEGKVLEVMNTIAGHDDPKAEWFRALFDDAWIVRDQLRIPSPFKGALTPRLDDMLKVEFGRDKSLQKVTLLRVDSLASNNDETKHYQAIQIFSNDQGKTIDVLLDNPHTLCPLPNSNVHFTFALRGKGPSRVIVETTEGRADAIRRMFCRVWKLPLSQPPVHPSEMRFASAEVVITPQMTADFMNVVSSAFGDPPSPASTFNIGDVVPMDVCASLIWECAMSPLVAPIMNINLLPILHRSNSYQMEPGAGPLLVGDKIVARSKVSRVKVQSTGKLIQVDITVCKGEHAVIHARSIFFSTGTSYSDEDSFEVIEEPTTGIQVDSTKMEALLRSRQWIQWEGDWGSKSLQGLSLTVRNMQSVSGLAASHIRESEGLEVVGTISDESKLDEVIGRISFKASSSASNPVANFLSRHGTSSTPTRVPLAKSGWSSPRSTVTITMPDCTRQYSQVSGDPNPIHTCPSHAHFAGLPGPIVHGMFTSAVVRHAIQRFIPGLGNNCIFHKWKTSFEGFVKPGEHIHIEVAHKAMVDGRMDLSVEAIVSERGDRVLTVEAEVEQPRSAYLFCGQGSQSKGMGMAMYEEDAVARAVWNSGDKALLDLYGFSILNIVRNNPKSLTVYFGGSHGRQLRSNYLALTTAVTGPDNVKRDVQIFDGITPASKFYSFNNENGLLSLTQFAQPAISLLNLAEFASLKARGLVQPNAMFAGHSLGEFSALAACAGIYGTETLMRLTFYRGMVMQSLFGKDGGSTDFGMVAVNPGKVSKDFTESDLVQTVERISQTSGLLLEVVNFNIKGQQYVCAGHHIALWILTIVLSQMPSASVDSTVATAVQAATEVAQPIQLQRTKATVPLSGVGIPFHSSWLRGSVDNYRETLSQIIKPCDVDPDLLVEKYIPNVIGKPFSLDADYIKEVIAVTGTESLAKAIPGFASPLPTMNMVKQEGMV